MNDFDVLREEKINSLAEEALHISKGRILANMRYLDSVIYSLRPIRATYGFATDGKYFYYEPTDILMRFKNGIKTLSRDYMHSIMHCLFRHTFVREPINHSHWNLATDIAVEALIDSLKIDCFDSPRGLRVHEYIVENKDIVTSFTAEKLYTWLNGRNITAAEMRRLKDVFNVDDHTMWYDHRMSKTYSRDVEIKSSGDCDVEAVSNNDIDDILLDLDENSISELAAEISQESLLTDIICSEIQNKLEEQWKNLSEFIQSDLSRDDGEQGMGSGIMKQALEELNREKIDYDSFLRRFAVRGEAIKLDLDSFDNIFYTYGLKLYGNVPLIEPLECGEEDKIRDLVVAIDTSGSTKGSVVENFLKKTYSILKTSDSFHKKVNLHIIQCDSKIQDDTVIHSVEDIDRYMTNMDIKGLGGTDFRPVFTYVDTLIKQGAFQNLHGLLYFTDGYGVFPRKKPEYDTAFIFVDNVKNNLEVPPWAIKIVLESEELQ